MTVRARIKTRPSKQGGVVRVYNDTIKRREEVEAFLAGGVSMVPGAYSRTVRFMVPVPER